MNLSKVLYVENDPNNSTISQKNRCYLWEQCQEGGLWAELDEADNYFLPPPPKAKKKQVIGRADDTVYYDFYQEMKEKKLRPMYDPGASMIVLDDDVKSKDVKLLRTLKNAIVWFLQEGPQGTETFFGYHTQKQFIH